jgi:3',5'-cyclic AMP phosphodiesterase CpdA
VSDQHFRFLHAGGFALDQPLAGLSEVPEPLEGPLIDAPYLAAQKVFAAALEERVDFVVLTGDLVDFARPSPRAIALLLDNFERLDSHGIAVYWAGGRLDPPQDWPASARLPTGAQIFPATGPKSCRTLRRSAGGVSSAVLARDGGLSSRH